DQPPAALAQTSSLEELNGQTLEQRAVGVAIWGTPIVSVNAMQAGLLSRRQSQLQRHRLLVEAVGLEESDDHTQRNRALCLFQLQHQGRATVVEILLGVEAGLFGTLLDAWQMPLADVGPEGEDQGKGGKYLLLPPDFKGEAPPGYFIVRPQTYNGYALFRAIPKGSSEADVSTAIAMVKNLRLYLVDKADNPPEQHFVD